MESEASFIVDKEPWQGGAVTARACCVKADNASPMTYVGTNSWILAEPGAASCVVVDPAPEGDQVQKILSICKERNLTVGAIVATHGHPDHVAGIPELAQRTGAPVFACDAALLECLLGDSDVPRFVVPEGPFCPFKGAPRLDVVYLPGHSSDSLGLLLTDEHTMLVGDLLFRHGPTVVFYPEGDLGSYLKSLDRLERLVRDGIIEQLLPAHGWPVNDPLRIIHATRTHRIERLDQIRDALVAGTPRNPEALFDVVYADVDPRLKDASLRSIRAQLVYLDARWE